MLAAAADELERASSRDDDSACQCYLQTSRQVRWLKAKRHAEINNNQLLKYDDRVVVASLPPW